MRDSTVFTFLSVRLDANAKKYCSYALPSLWFVLIVDRIIAIFCYTGVSGYRIFSARALKHDTVEFRRLAIRRRKQLAVSAVAGV